MGTSSQQVLDSALRHYEAGRFAEAQQRCRELLAREPEHAGALNLLGIMLIQQGERSAIELLEKAVRLAPAEPNFLTNLGFAYGDLGRLEEAVRCFREVASSSPASAQAAYNLGVAQTNLRQFEDAAESYRRATELEPQFGQAHHGRAVSLCELERYEEALQSARHAAEILPNDAATQNNLADILGRLGRMDEAEARLRQLTMLSPASAQVAHNLGVAQSALRRFGDAAESYRRATELDPGFGQAHHGLALSLWELGRYEEALQSQRHAVQLLPNDAEAHNNLGNILTRLGKHEEAERALRLALAIEPLLGMAYSNLGNVLHALRRLSEAEEAYQTAIELDPQMAETHNNRGNTLLALGRLQDAEQSFRRALELNPDYVSAHSNLIFLMDFLSGYSVQAQQAERRGWYERHARVHAAALAPLANAPQPERRLRIGYVSSDFRSHSAYHIFGPVIREHERSSFEMVCYSGGVQEDLETERMKRSADAWRNTVTMTDEALAESIREDGIDILVDLSGHTAGHRLLVFARKPAPIQVHAWGHATGTGLATMDYFLADPVLVPPQERSLYAEEIFDLPCCLCIDRPEALPEPTPLPALSAQRVTFGCANRVEKITPAAIAVWSRIMAAVPDSVLLIKDRGLDDTENRGLLLAKLVEAGIAPERVLLIGYTLRAEHLEVFRQIDIALDPFPQGGGVSTAEGLWMGVPAVALMGATPASRASASMLTALGMGEWVARDPDEYVRIAVQAAGDLPRLARLRETLRQRLTDSPVGNPRLYCRALEAAYRTMWRRWCEKRSRASVA